MLLLKVFFHRFKETVTIPLLHTKFCFLIEFPNFAWGHIHLVATQHQNHRKHSIF